MYMQFSIIFQFVTLFFLSVKLKANCYLYGIFIIGFFFFNNKRELYDCLVVNGIKTNSFEFYAFIVFHTPPSKKVITFIKVHVIQYNHQVSIQLNQRNRVNYSHDLISSIFYEYIDVHEIVQL